MSNSKSLQSSEGFRRVGLHPCRRTPLPSVVDAVDGRSRVVGVFKFRSKTLGVGRSFPFDSGPSCRLSSPGTQMGRECG